MKRLLVASAHFPPDSSATAHRARLLLPHLPQHGWEPTLVTVDPRDSGARLDDGLAALVPASLRVVRCRAWPRRFGVGDLGLRSLLAMRRRCAQLLAAERFDALWVIVPPFYSALLGPLLSRVPYVLDYSDPWVSEWGRSVGPGGRPDLKARLSRWAALALEPAAVRGAAALTAVSEGTWEGILQRNRSLGSIPRTAIPYGCEPADFAHVGRHPGFDPHDGSFHLVSVGTLLPLGLETLRAVLSAVTRLPDGARARLRLHFYGTSNQFHAGAPARVTPLADALGVPVDELAPRLDYLDALSCLKQASALLLMGSSERHYTASRLFPALLAERPILAVFHRASSVSEILARAGRVPSVRLVTYDDELRAESQAGAILEQLEALLANPVYDPSVMDLGVLREQSAASLAGRLATVLDEACRRRP